jgi:tRNA(Ile)-lysidine synthase
MLSRFQKYIEDKKLAAKADRLLAAVSGGIDSMVMIHLLNSSGYKTAIAHCNFGLRDQESDEDAAFVRQYAETHDLPYFIEHFNTIEYARARKISIQMAAREIRYEWLEQIRNDCDYQSIAIAHNLDDSIETLFLNISRGTGIRGLTGIPVKTGNIIRPLLFASREEITVYAHKHQIPFREDSSNIEEKYRRNFIRHSIVPLFREINPSFSQAAAQMFENLNQVRQIYLDEMNRIEKKVIAIRPGETRIRIEDLRKQNSSELFLQEFLSVSDFSPATVAQIAGSLDSESGRSFYSPTHRIVKDRNDLILTLRESGLEKKYYIDEDTTQITEPIQIDFLQVDAGSDYKVPRDPAIACLDLHTLHFPLVLRKWQKGDYFQPFGMQGLKKLSDFFIDNKLSLIEKENTWILVSGNKVVWVVGYRIDDRFRITPRTSKIWMASIREAGK